MLKSYCEEFQKFRNQYKAIAIVNLISLVHGSATGWLSPTVPFLQSDDTHLDHPITMAELSWIGGLLSLGGIVGNFMFSIIAERFGRKFALIILALPNLTFWTLLIFSSQVFHIYLARFCAGLTGGGLFVVLPVYVAEIADPSVRGKLNGCMSLIVSIGVLCGYVLVEVLPTNYIAYVMSGLPILYLVALMSLPETPDYLIRIDKFEEAKQAVWFYKSYEYQNNQLTRQLFEKDIQQMEQVLLNRKTGLTTKKITKKDFREF